MTEPDHVRATRMAYDIVAVDYEALLRDELAAQPFDRGVLDTFAELVPAAGAGAVADIGCGPGRVTAYLHARGLSAFGIDLSPAMVAVARATHPALRFEEGSMTALDLPDDALAGIVAWYSIIHTPPETLPEVFAEFLRVLAPGAFAVLAFQVGDSRVHLEHAYGHAISLDAYRLSPARVRDQLRDSGFAVRARLLREPDGRETTPQAYVFARKPAHE